MDQLEFKMFWKKVITPLNESSSPFVTNMFITFFDWIISSMPITLYLYSIAVEFMSHKTPMAIKEQKIV